jgi:hypothetical protein
MHVKRWVIARVADEYVATGFLFAHSILFIKRDNDSQENSNALGQGFQLGQVVPGDLRPLHCALNRRLM